MDLENFNETLTPAEIVSVLDRHIVGQKRAKRLVAIALRNRWRRLQLDKAVAAEVLPKHILMVGPTGCGKTEISRRLAQIVKAPFIKVEASKFTEVGYVGRDVTSIVKDLLAVATEMVEEEQVKKHRDDALKAARTKVLSVLLGSQGSGMGEAERGEKFQMLCDGGFDEEEIEIDLKDDRKAGFSMDLPGVSAVDLSAMMSRAMGGERTIKRKVKVKRALSNIQKEEERKRIDEQQVSDLAVRLVESKGIVFLDEIDKILESREGAVVSGGVSREGVQRDLLPLIEGTIVRTNQGTVDTRHILFIAAGAFHMAKPGDLIPELQGRLPVRVELNALTQDDMLRILTQPKHSLIKQYKQLLKVEGLEVDFDEAALEMVAKLTYQLNQESGNVGARRLFTVMEHLLEDLLFEAHMLGGKSVTISESEVANRLAELMGKGNENVSML